MPSDDAETIYAVRLAGSAARLIADEYARQEALNGQEAADRWRDGMLDTTQSLATLPSRCAVARENHLFPGAVVRQILYLRLWRLLFTVHAADENDPPTVWVRHIRHGAQGQLASWPEEEKA